VESSSTRLDALRALRQEVRRDLLAESKKHEVERLSEHSNLLHKGRPFILRRLTGDWEHFVRFARLSGVMSLPYVLLYPRFEQEPDVRQEGRLDRYLDENAKEGAS
jgi:hypothetical protein